MIRKNWLSINYSEMTEDEVLARDTMLMLGNIIVKVKNGLENAAKAKEEIEALQNNEEAFEAASNEMSTADLREIIRLLEGSEKDENKTIGKS